MSRPKRKTPKVRLNLDTSEGTRARLERLKGKIDADSFGEVIRRALCVYEAVIDEQARCGDRKPPV